MSVPSSSQTHPPKTSVPDLGAITDFLKSVKSIRKRDGRIESFDAEKLHTSLVNAFTTCGFSAEKYQQTISRIHRYALHALQRQFDGHTVPSSEEVHRAVAVCLLNAQYIPVSRAYLAYRQQSVAQQEKALYGNGLSFERFFTTAGRHPYEELAWERRDAEIKNEKGESVFKQKHVEVPTGYSQSATNILASKYFRGRLEASDRESSARQVIDRVAKTIASWGRKGGYFQTEEDAQVYEDELTSILINQRAAFNSPVWFNVGIQDRPQCSACFINSVEDDMRSILQLAVTEGMLFKYGSGAGSNLSTLRSSRENLGGSSGKSSGPISFMRGFDAFAGVIKSGGKTRRAAKMVILNVEHPDVLDFVWCKAKEEKKAHALIDSGYDGTLNGEAYSSIFFQNANNSVRVTDTFMQSAEQNGEFWTRYILTGERCESHRAREVLRQISDAAWQCGDPGLQYDTTINTWHTCPNTDRIHASNPCSEYMFLNDSACNLASVNLMRFQTEDGGFDVSGFEHACRILITAQEILVGYSSYPTPAIEYHSHRFRPLGLGYANLGALLMSMGLPYDSDAGRNMAAALTAILTGTAYEQSARIAEKLGAFDGFEENREPMLRVIGKHRDYAKRIATDGVPEAVLSRAQSCWDEALNRGERSGFRNAQASVLAPTGTIAFLMDCDTTGVEPDIALVKYKWLVGGGMMKIVNQTVPRALEQLGYSDTESEDILSWISEHDTIEGAPHLKSDHLPVFDCAFRAANGERSIHYMGHLRMMAAVQPFISGAISKTVNLPADATVEDVMDVYFEGWRLGLKAVAIYRDGCKRAQPLTTRSTESAPSKKTATENPPGPRRRRLPDERRSITHKFRIGAQKGYLTVGLYDDGTPGELFVTMSKEGSVLSGLLDVISTSVSIGLQYGVPLKVLVNKFAHVRFEPSGFTGHEQIRFAKSIVDYIFRWLALKFLSSSERQSIGINIDPLIADRDPWKNASDPEGADASVAQQSLLIPEEETGSDASDRDDLKSAAPSLVSTFDNQSDAPACDTCGSMMVRNGACYKCLNCGATSGCS